MKHLTVESFVNSMNEEDLWKIIEDYENWKETGEDENSLLRNKAREFCSNLTLPLRYHSDWMPKIAMGAYRHFALKYKEMVK